MMVKRWFVTVTATAFTAVCLMVGCDLQKPRGVGAAVFSEGKKPRSAIQMVYLGDLTERFVEETQRNTGPNVFGIAFDAERVEGILEAIISDVDSTGESTEQLLYKSCIKIYDNEFGNEARHASGLLTISLPTAISLGSKEELDLRFTSVKPHLNSRYPNRLRLPLSILTDELVQETKENWVYSVSGSASTIINNDDAPGCLSVPSSISLWFTYDPADGESNPIYQSTKKLEIRLSLKFLESRKSIADQVKAIRGEKDISRSARLIFYEFSDLPVPDEKEEEGAGIPIEGFSTLDGRVAVGGSGVAWRGNSMSVKVVEATKDSTTYSLEIRDSSDRAILFSDEYKVPTDVYKSFFPVPASLWRAISGGDSDEKHMGFLFVNDDAVPKE